MGSSLIGRSGGILVVLAVLLTACGSEEPAVLEGIVTLAEVDGSGVSGVGNLRWDPDRNVLSVTLDLEGVEAGATYLTVIGAGCTVPSDVVFQTGTAEGGPDGTARIATDLSDVEAVDLDGGWSLWVVRPPVGQQACGQVGTS